MYFTLKNSLLITDKDCCVRVRVAVYRDWLQDNLQRRTTEAVPSSQADNANPMLNRTINTINDHVQAAQQ